MRTTTYLKQVLIGAILRLIGRQGLEGPPTKEMLLWPGAYICTWLSGYLGIFLSRPRVPTSFSQCLVLPPLQLPCQKDQPEYRRFD